MGKDHDEQASRTRTIQQLQSLEKYGIITKEGKRHLKELTTKGDINGRKREKTQEKHG